MKIQMKAKKIRVLVYELGEEASCFSASSGAGEACVVWIASFGEGFGEPLASLVFAGTDVSGSVVFGVLGVVGLAGLLLGEGEEAIFFSGAGLIWLTVSETVDDTSAVAVSAAAGAAFASSDDSDVGCLIRLLASSCSRELRASRSSSVCKSFGDIDNFSRTVSRAEMSR